VENFVKQGMVSEHLTGGIRHEQEEGEPESRHKEADDRLAIRNAE